MATKITEFVQNANKIDININLIKEFLKKCNKPCKVVTIIGNARCGKSAFLNCLTTYFNRKTTKTDLAPFTSQSSKQSNCKDVTVGANGFYMDAYKTLFIDMQGINGIYSDADPLVMLFCYLISDLLIINTDKQLNTASLTALQPISAKLQAMQNVSQFHKPRLVFRVFDCLDNYDDIVAQQNYDIMMEERNDSVKGVRQAIKELFIIDKLKIVWTERPNKTDLEEVDKGNISKFITNFEFDSACEKLYNYIITIPIRKDFTTQSILKCAEELNQDSNRVSASEFDTASLVNEQAIRWWLSGDVYGEHKDKVSQIPDELKTPLNIVACDQTNQDILIARRNAVKACHEQFMKRFEKSPEYLRVGGEKQLTELIDMHLINAKRTFDKYYSDFVHDVFIPDINKYLALTNKPDELQQNASPLKCKKIRQIRKTDDINMQIVLENLNSPLTSIVQLRPKNIPEYGMDENDANKFCKKFINAIISKVYNIGSKCIEKNKALLEKYVSDIKQHFADKDTIYNEKLNKKIAQISNKFDNDIKNIPNLTAPYVDALELNYNEIFELIKKSNDSVTIKSTLSSLVSRFLNYLNIEQKSDQNEDDQNTFVLDIQYYTFSVDSEKCLIAPYVNVNKVFAQESTIIEESLGKFAISFEDYQDVFTKLRADRMSVLLDEINKLPLAERLQKYDKIKHNNLYMNDFAYDSNFRTLVFDDMGNYLRDDYEMFMDKDDNMKIYTKEQFEKQFSSEFHKLYQLINTRKHCKKLSKCLMNRIFAVWVNDFINEIYSA